MRPGEQLTPEGVYRDAFDVVRIANYQMLHRLFPERLYPVHEDGWGYELLPGIHFSESEARLAQLSKGRWDPTTRKILAYDHRYLDLPNSKIWEGEVQVLLAAEPTELSAMHDATEILRRVVNRTFGRVLEER